MRYVIVSVLKGRAGEFNNDLRKDVFSKFNLKSSKLPAHFTIKGPFEYNKDIKDLEKRIESVCKNEKAYPFKIDGYNHFDDRVIYMEVKMSKEGKDVHDKLIDEMDKLSYINFDKKDGKGKIFHVTITSKKLKPLYDEVWSYVNKFHCKFDCLFDNVSIYKWEENTWKLYKEFRFNECIKGLDK